MRHVQRLGNQGRTRTIAGSLALVSGLALFSVARAPLAVGQLATVNVGNDGAAVASTGGNTATGNNSSNTVQGTSATGGGLLGGLVDADVTLGGASNTSTGTATVTSGTATASGNGGGTSVNQTTNGGSSSTFTPSNPFGGTSGFNQAATVNNEGNSVASTGGNNAIGNNSENMIGSTNSVGAIDAVVDLGAGASNTSTGTANVTSGPASASGNTSNVGVNQARTADTGFASTGFGSGAGGGGAAAGGGFVNATPFFPGTFPGTVSGFGSSFDPCSGRFLPFSPFFNDPSGQRATVGNTGTAAATTGNNTAIGNNSTNNAVINQTAASGSGGLIGLNVNLGNATNNSSGTATVNSGAANASGNNSATNVNQACGQAAPTATGGGGGLGAQPSLRNPITGGPIVVPQITTPIVVSPSVQTGTLARTGFESGMIVVAVALVLFGMALLITARRRLTPATGRVAVSQSEWDSIVRW